MGVVQFTRNMETVHTVDAAAVEQSTPSTRGDLRQA